MATEDTDRPASIPEEVDLVTDDGTAIVATVEPVQPLPAVVTDLKPLASRGPDSFFSK